MLFEYFDELLDLNKNVLGLREPLPLRSLANFFHTVGQDNNPLDQNKYNNVF